MKQTDPANPSEIAPIQIFLADTAATCDLGRKLGQSLPPNSVVLLFGDLGAGKTTLVQGLGAGLGIRDSIVSPTFTLVNEYLDGRLPLYHLDLYRLHPSEVSGIEPEFYWEGIEVEPGITAIEWSERLPYYPARYLAIHLSHATRGERSATLQLMNEGILEHFKF
jgi:tRNA threonylcarbamoyladenosine biosynthesis protein TsaE